MRDRPKVIPVLDGYPVTVLREVNKDTVLVRLHDGTEKEVKRAELHEHDKRA